MRTANAAPDGPARQVWRKGWGGGVVDRGSNPDCRWLPARKKGLPPGSGMPPSPGGVDGLRDDDDGARRDGESVDSGAATTTTHGTTPTNSKECRPPRFSSTSRLSSIPKRATQTRRHHCRRARPGRCRRHARSFGRRKPRKTRPVGAAPVGDFDARSLHAFNHLLELDQRRVMMGHRRL